MAATLLGLLALAGCGGDPTLTGSLAPPAPGSLTVSVIGLPPGAPASLTLSNASGYHHTFTGPETIPNLTAGPYTLSAASVTAEGDGYDPATGTQTVSVHAGPSATTATVEYAVVTGRIDLAIAGLPAGADAAVTVSGPGGFSLPATASGLLKGLVPGTYTVRAAAVTVAGDGYAPAADSLLVPVTAGPTASPAAVSYSIVTGRLDLTVAGAPDGTTPAVTVTGPGGFQETVAATTSFVGLEPGTYAVTAPALTSGGHRYDPAVAPASIDVAAGTTPATGSVTFALATGGLTVTVTGLPAGSAADLTLAGPGGSQALTGPTSLVGLEPGDYVLTAAGVSAGGGTWIGTPTSQTIGVSASLTPAQATVTYSRGTGSLDLTIAGLPGGASAQVAVTGPNGYARTVGASQVLSGLDPGTYTVTASSVSAGGQTYLPSPPSQSAAVTIGATAAAAVAYGLQAGGLAVTVAGLPGGAAAQVRVTGPGGYDHAVTASATLTGLLAGTYTVTADSVASGGTTYGPGAAAQHVGVTGGSTANVTVTYAAAPPPPPPTTFNLVVDGMYLTQAAQRYDGSVPLVAGRDAYLRVFVKANQSNSATPAVRVRFYSGGTLVQTSTIGPPGGSVPTSVTEGTLASSWNMLVPAALMQPNLKVLVDVDPTNAVPESSDADNGFPTSGTPFAVDVRSLPTFHVRFVPVLQSANGLQGNVTAGNQAQFLTDLLKMLPVADYDVDLHAVYTTTAPAVQSSNGNGAWGTILSEIWALKGADGSSRYYYGVLKASYTSGVAGIGYVGGGINSALGWDYLPSGAGVMAHEVGHNMSRSHAPCGGVAGPDPSYPYTGGQLGIYGLDLATLTVKSPTATFDLMGYCNPVWISDYNWSGMLQYRQSNASYAPPAAAVAGDGLLVWGRVTGGGIVLEPAFPVRAPITPPAASAAYRVEGLSTGGRVLFSYPVRPVQAVDDVQAPELQFAAVLPVAPAAAGQVATLRFVTPSGTAVRTSPRAGGRTLFMPDPAAAAARPDQRQARLQWDGATYPMALVRDAATGQILSFARGGQATIWTAAGTLDVTFSDGIQARTARLVVR